MVLLLIRHVIIPSVIIETFMLMTYRICKREERINEKSKRR